MAKKAGTDKGAVKGKGAGAAAAKAAKALSGKGKAPTKEKAPVKEKAPTKEKAPVTKSSAPVSSGETGKAVAKAETTGKQVTVTRKAVKCRETIQKNLDKINDAYYDLALSIKEYFDSDYAVQFGFSNFKTAAEAGEFGELGYRQAYYMVEIGNAIVTQSIPRERIGNIGWSKLKEVAKLVEKAETQEQVEDLLNKAENLSKADLIAEIREVRGRPARAAALRLSCTFETTEGQIVSSALQVAIDTIGKDDVTAAIAYVCSEFLNLKGESPERTTLESWIEYLEGQYGVTLRVEERGSTDPLEAAGEEQVVDPDEFGLGEALEDEAPVSEGMADATDKEIDDLLEV